MNEDDIFAYYYLIAGAICLIFGLYRTIREWKNKEYDGVDIFYWIFGYPLAGPLIVLIVLPLVAIWLPTYLIDLARK